MQDFGNPTTGRRHFIRGRPRQHCLAPTGLIRTVPSAHDFLAVATSLLLLFLSLTSSIGAAQDFENLPRVFLDPYFSFETGTGLTHTAVWALGGVEDRALSPLQDNRPLGISARFFRTLLFDAPVAWWFGVFEHEAFGHGGRGREFGAETDFHMGSPWGGRDSYATLDAKGLSTEDLLRVYSGGSESNGWTATLMERDLVAGRVMRPMELLFLVSNRFVVSDYVLRTTPNPMTEPQEFFREWAGGGDVANYLGYLNTLFRGTPEITPVGSSDQVQREYGRLRRQAYWNAADPGAWLALFGAARYIITGNDSEPIPLPELAGRRFLPVLTADWLPDGGVASLELIFGPLFESSESVVLGQERRWFSFTFRRGRGPGGAIGAVGAATDQVYRGERFRLGGEMELWSRPRHGLGGAFRARFSGSGGWKRGLFLDVGVKSDGHWPGRPAETGPFILIGVCSDSF